MKEEELRKAADEYTSSDKIRYIQDATDRDVEDAFVEGAEWALEHQWISVDNSLPETDVAMWIARNEDGGLILSIGKPYLPRTYYVGKLERRWLPTGNNKHVLTINRVVDDNLHEHYDKGMFPEVTFEKSPIEVELTIKEKYK